ncbi:hypothetical protein [Enterococcus sp.]|uniref:hypothetical protein n=1 Tax=Enterococcus sp. TaxID=35783 RepID=UPI002FCAC2CA
MQKLVKVVKFASLAALIAAVVVGLLCLCFAIWAWFALHLHWIAATVFIAFVLVFICAVGSEYGL